MRILDPFSLFVSLVVSILARPRVQLTERKKYFPIYYILLVLFLGSHLYTDSFTVTANPLVCVVLLS